MNHITIDATNKSFGRLASETATTLRGKNNPSYKPHMISDVIVEIKNIDKVRFTGKKLEQKTYHRATGYPGGLKTERLSQRIKNNPEEAFKKTVRLMLPKNKHRDLLLKRIKFI